MNRDRAFGTTRRLSGGQPGPLEGALTAATAAHPHDGDPQHPRLQTNNRVYTAEMHLQACVTCRHKLEVICVLGNRCSIKCMPCGECLTRVLSPIQGVTAILRVLLARSSSVLDALPGLLWGAAGRGHAILSAIPASPQPERMIGLQLCTRAGQSCPFEQGQKPRDVTSFMQSTGETLSLSLVQA